MNQFCKLTNALMATKGASHMFLFLSFSCFLLLMGHSYSQRDSLQQGDELKDGEVLDSSFGKFTLGFFTPSFSSSYSSISSSSKRYVGIWYNQPGDRYDSAYYDGEQSSKAVWIANRNIPILGKSGSLRIDRTDGNLKIFHIGGIPIPITSVKAAGNTSVTLQQSGNLVLHELHPNGSIKGMLWQSFDYPTDILLPGMKLGIDLQTGHQWFLQSWLTYESPAPGSYTFGMDHNFTDQLIIRWLGEIQWTSGPWQDGKFNSWVVGDYKFSYTSNEQERYFNYSVNDDVASFPILQISRFGHLDDHRGLPIACSVGAYCGAYENLPMCSRGSSNPEIKYGFMSREGSKFKESDNMTLGDCRLKCLKNCSCVAYAATNREKKTGCEIWGREAKFTESYKDNYRIIYLKVETKEIKPWIWLIFAIVGALQVILLCSFSYVARRKYKGKEEKWWLSLTVAAGIVLLIPLLCYLCYLAWRKLRAEVQRIMNRRKLLRELEDNLPSSTKNKGGKTKGKDQNMNHELKIFNFQTIVAATNNFSTTNKLGEGGFGPVYKGKLLDAQEIAIKRLSRRSGQGIVEFKNEAKLISKLQHNNLVKLFGCSLQGEERVLVYEYMPNKSLDFFLFDSKRKKLLGWKKRLNIIEGIAQGLIYLHKYSRLKVIHRDLKASNILLDEQMNPKISDFGMARIFEVNESEANTNRVVGTYGYMSPEYAMSGIVSMKTDVFSFGVIVLEIVSGKKNNSCYHTKHPLNLIGYAWQLWNEGKGLELIDTALERSCSPNEVLRCVHVGLLCVQDQAANRPTISDVVSMLANETMLLPAPKQPAFFINVNSEEQEASKIKLDNNSTNDVTISVLEAR